MLRRFAWARASSMWDHLISIGRAWLLFIYNRYTHTHTHIRGTYILLPTTVPKATKISSNRMESLNVKLWIITVKFKHSAVTSDLKYWEYSLFSQSIFFSHSHFLRLCNTHCGMFGHMQLTPSSFIIGHWPYKFNKMFHESDNILRKKSSFAFLHRHDFYMYVCHPGVRMPWIVPYSIH